MTMPSYIINWEDILRGLSIEDSRKILGSLRDLSENQRTIGVGINVPLLQDSFKIMEWIAKENTALVGITYSQSSYSNQDYWELWVDGDRIFETVYTKELGEVKHWETVHYVYEGQTIRIIHHNISGTKKDIWIDLEYSGKGELITK